MHRSVFKTALLVYNLLHSGYQNTLNLSLDPDTVCTEHLEVNLMVCCSRSHILHQYTNLKSILAPALHMMLQGFGMICLMMYAQLYLALHSERT